MSAVRTVCAFLVGAMIVVHLAGCASEDPPGSRSGEGAESRDVRSSANETLDRRAQNLLIEGQRAFQRGDYEGAMARLDSAEIYAPDAPVIPYNRGRVYRALNRIDAARAAFQEAIERDPVYPEVRLQLGDIALQRGDLKSALDFYRGEEAVEPSSELYVKMGEAYYRIGEADSARAAYEKAIAADSANATAHMMYGQLLEETGRLEEALRSSRNALSIEPDRPNYQYAVGSQLYQLGRLEESVEYLKPAADARLLHYPAQYSLGQAMLRLGRDEEAEHYLARADSSRELMNRITAAQSRAALNPDSVAYWIRLGELFRLAGERDQAVQAFNRAAVLEPDNLTVQKNLGEMMLADGNVQAAIQRFQAVVQADRYRVDAWKSLALAHAAAGQCSDARRALTVALELRPGDSSLVAMKDGLCRVGDR